MGSGSPGGDFRDGKGGDTYLRPYNRQGNGLKPKDLCMIPARVALALQADGWWLRSVIIWHKPSCMPEPVTDRPTTAHEYVYLLAKSADYYCDMEAIKEASVDPESHKGHRPRNELSIVKYDPEHSKTKAFHKILPGTVYPTRNKRTVWAINSEPTPYAHFATFPQKLVEPCIMAGTSEKGNCGKCGKPWVRVVEKTKTFESGSGRSGNPIVGKYGEFLQGGGGTGDIRRGPCISSRTVGWQPSCTCNGKFKRIMIDDIEQIIYEPSISLGDHSIVPSIVLDPFSGSGTTGRVAKKLKRNYVLIDLSPEYNKIAERLLAGQGEYLL